SVSPRDSVNSSRVLLPRRFPFPFSAAVLAVCAAAASAQTPVVGPPGAAVATSRNDFLGTANHLSSLDITRIRSGQDLSRIPGAVADIMKLAQPGTGVVGSGAAGLVLG